MRPDLSNQACTSVLISTAFQAMVNTTAGCGTLIIDLFSIDIIAVRKRTCDVIASFLISFSYYRESLIKVYIYYIDWQTNLLHIPKQNGSTPSANASSRRRRTKDGINRQCQQRGQAARAPAQPVCGGGGGCAVGQI
jgi:hypothetical protein